MRTVRTRSSAPCEGRGTACGGGVVFSIRKKPPLATCSAAGTPTGGFFLMFSLSTRANRFGCRMCDRGTKAYNPYAEWHERAFCAKDGSPSLGSSGVEGNLSLRIVGFGLVAHHTQNDFVACLGSFEKGDRLHVLTGLHNPRFAKDLTRFFVVHA